jgi:hypothetical protein
MKARLLNRLLGALTLVLLVAAGADAQNIGASVRGKVTDSTHAALPGARVVVTNSATHATKESLSDLHGLYHVPLLPPGDYTVGISYDGFRSVTQRLTLTVGQDALVDMVLEPTGVAESVVIESRTSGINLVSGALSGVVGQQEIRDLPLNGRSFQQLAALQAGVTTALAAGNDVVGGRTPKLSINGARPEQSSFILDGTDINNVYNKTPGSVAGVLLGVEAVREFQVLTNSYSAEFGRSAGGVINVVTRSGTNDVHGSLFEFHRNSALDARNYFDLATQPKPSFTRHQFGGALGGALQRDRTFFFAAYEGLIERLGVTGVATVPDDEARQGRLPSRTVTLHPAIPAYLDLLFPVANGRNLGGGAAEYLFSPKQPTDEHFAQLRIDHRLTPNDTMFARYTYDRGDVDRQYPNKPPLAFSDESSRTHYVTAEHQHTFSHALVNVARVGLNKSTHLADAVRTVDIPPSMSWIPGEPFGYLTIAGLVTEHGGDIRLPRNDRLTSYQFGDTLLFTRGAHSARVGMQVQRFVFNQDSISSRGGIVSFTNLETFLTGRPETVDFAVPGQWDPIRKYRQWMWGFFVQDDVRLTSRLSANIGVRYEFITVPTEADGKVANVRNVTDTAITVGDPWHENPSLGNVAPRLGVSWDPLGDGKTAVRGGFGLFHDQLLPKYYFFSGSLNAPFTTRTSLRNPPFPNVVEGFDPSTIKPTVQTINYDLQNPYMMQFNVNVQRSLARDWDATIGYVGSRGKNLLRVGDANLAPETVVDGVKTYQPLLGRRNPSFAGLFQRVTDAESFYNALQVTVAKSYSRGWRAQLAYTLSRTVDDASGINGQDFDNVTQYGLDWYDRTLDRGLAAFHAKHNLTFNWTWDLPWARSAGGLKQALLGGWQINNITSIRSGHPFTVRNGFNRSGNLNTINFAAHDRPNVKPGNSNNPILGGPDRYWDIRAFELQPVNQRGNLGRNTLIGPGLVAIDLALVKSIEWKNRRRLEVRAECFNVPNHPNFATPSGRTAFTRVMTPAEAAALQPGEVPPNVAPNWGRITSTVTTARQVQLGLKLSF